MSRYMQKGYNHTNVHTQYVQASNTELNHKKSKVYLKSSLKWLLWVSQLLWRLGTESLSTFKHPNSQYGKSNCWGNFSCRNMITYFICKKHTFKWLCTHTCNPNKVFTALHSYTSKWILTYTHTQSKPPPQPKNFHVSISSEQSKEHLNLARPQRYTAQIQWTLVPAHLDKHFPTNQWGGLIRAKMASLDCLWTC